MSGSPASPSPIVVLDSVQKSWADGSGRTDVLRGVNLTVNRGESVAIVGASGSGKSTLLHLVGGLDRHYRGTVSVNGHDLARLDDAALSGFRARTVGFVFQSFNLVPTCSALENVLLPSWFATGAEPDEALRERARQALKRVGLGDRTERLPGQLSGGERQRVAVARALFAKPAVLLADEPTGNLDAVTGAGIIELFRELQSEGLTLLVVTHEERMWRAAGRTVRLEGGVLHDADESREESA